MTKESADSSPAYSVDTGRLVETSPGTRPDFVIVGEVRGPEETRSLSGIAATGHGGLSSFRANSPEEVILGLAGRIGPEETQLALPWLSLHISKIPKADRILRGAAVLDEFVPEGGKVEVRNISRYGIPDDSCNISTAAEVVQRGRRLRSLSEKGTGARGGTRKTPRTAWRMRRGNLTDIGQSLGDFPRLVEI